MIYLACGHELELKKNKSVDKALERLIYFWDSADREGNKTENYGCLCNNCAFSFKARKNSKYNI